MRQTVAAKVKELMRWPWRQAWMPMPKLAFYWLEGQGQYLYLI